MFEVPASFDRTCAALTILQQLINGRLDGTSERLVSEVH
jgi:hypothetical protein